MTTECVCVDYGMVVSTGNAIGDEGCEHISGIIANCELIEHIHVGGKCAH